MRHIFVSYSRHDKAYARKLADHLIAAGFDVWIDDRIDYGSRWAEVIQQAIEDCAAFVVIMTPRSRESHWVQTECEYAIQKRKPVFPLLREGEVFFRYISVQAVDVTDGALPPQAFLDELAEHAPQRGGRGEDVAHLDVDAPPPAGLSPPSAPAKPSAARRKARPRAPIVFGVAIGIVVLAIVALLLRERAGPDEFDKANTATSASLSFQNALELLAGAEEETPDSSTECQFEWFFPTELALEGECPVPGYSELDGFVQRWGDGVLIGVGLGDSGGRYFTLLDTGEYGDFIGDWDTSDYSVGACVESTTYGFMMALPEEEAAAEDYSCPLHAVQFGTTRIQASTTTGEYVFYVEAADETIYRLAAPSSNPGTQGTWQRIR